MNRSAIGPAPGFGPLDLLVLQPTPFCNIDCSYCYLPDRQSRARMPRATLDATFARVFEADGLVRGGFTVVWHAGEPLVLPVAYYEEALGLLAEHCPDDVRVEHSFQTNGTLLTPAWCDFVRSHPVRIGVSLDGPAFLHDAFRKTRAGRGTHAKVMEGVRLLREREVPFHVIAVLTRDALDYPDEIYAFFLGHGVDSLGFNVEEIEGPHRSSSLEGADIRGLYERFLARFYDLDARDGWPIRVREFDSTVAAIVAGGDLDGHATHETTPLAILSVDWRGNFCTFSPELLGLPTTDYGDFALGNVLDGDLLASLETPRFRAISADIEAGRSRCRETCDYFAFCGGGAPVNKYFENGRFDSTETLFCRLNRKALLDVVVAKLEAGAAPPPPPRPPEPAMAPA